MGKKLSLLFAAAMLAFTFQTAMAQDDDMDMDDDIDIEQHDDDFSPSRRWSRHMGIGNRWGGGPGHGPAMRGHDRMGSGRRMGPGRGMGHGRHMGMGGMGMGMRMMDKLDLTADQKRQAVEVMTDNYRQMLLARLDMSEAYKTLKDLHESDNPDHDAIIAANQAVGAANGRMDVLARKFKDNVKGILTPEQKEKFEEFGKKMRDFKGDRGGRGERDGKGRPPRLQTGPGPRMMDQK